MAAKDQTKNGVGFFLTLITLVILVTLSFMYLLPFANNLIAGTTTVSLTFNLSL